MDIIILAAGRGSRLRPLTDTLPKPLIEIGGISLIELHLYHLAMTGYGRVIINLHHLGESIKVKLGNGQRYGVEIVYSEEPDEALETAGGIVNALHLIESARFAAISADVLCDYPLGNLSKVDMAGVDAHLVMVENPAHHSEGDFSLNASGRITIHERNGRKPAYTYSGLACFKRAMFEGLSSGKRALRPVLESAIKEQQLMGELYTGLWSDIGTPERLDQARTSAGTAAYIESIKQSIS